MKIAETYGLNMSNPMGYRPITVRTETTGKHKTLSLADETTGTMLLIKITPEVQKLLKELCE